MNDFKTIKWLWLPTVILNALLLKHNKNIGYTLFYKYNFAYEFEWMRPNDIKRMALKYWNNCWTNLWIYSDT